MKISWSSEELDLRKALSIYIEGGERNKDKAADPMLTLHIEENNNLRRFGFPIYGCIDGLSRTLM